MLTLRTLGELRLETGSTARLSSPRKELTLLAFLARRSPRSAEREELAELLWGDRDSGKARQSLRQALLELKRLVGDGLVLESNKVRLATGAVALDASLFQSDVAAGRWADAAPRWRGDFLAGTDDFGGEDFRTWLEAEREGLRSEFRRTVRELIEAARRSGAWDDGIGWAELWVQMLPLEEEGHQRLVEMMQLGGRTAEALAHHSSAQAQLRSSLEVELSPAFVALGRELERGHTRRSSHTPASAALFTPDLVGRAAALSELDRVWTAVRQGVPAGVAIEGEAGIGKTRLCEEFLRRVVGLESTLVLRTRGEEGEQTSDMDGARDLLAHLHQLPEVGGASPRALAEIACIVPEMAERFSSLPPALGTSHALMEGVCEVLEVIASDRPIVIYLDDFPSIDLQSQRLIVAVAERIGGRVLFLITTRTGDQPRHEMLLRLYSHAGTRRIILNSLAAPEIEALLSSMLELSIAQRRELALQIHQQGGGNPLYTIELMAALVDGGWVQTTDTGTWRVQSSVSGRSLPLPVTLREVVGRRLEHLTRATREVMEGAAVIGRSFDPDLVATVAGVSPATSAVALEELVSRRLIHEATATPGMFEFAHEITWRVVYERLSPERRESLHLTAAKVWSTRVRDTSTRAALQFHRARAGARQPRRWPRLLLGSAAAVLLIAGAAFVLIPAGQRARLETLLIRPTPVLSARRIVVAPLTNHTGDSSLTALGALAADWIAQALTRTTQFEVVDPRTALFAGRIVDQIPALLRDRNRAIAVAEETGSGTVLSGDLFRDGDTLRALIQVVDATTGRIIRTVDPVSGPIKSPSGLIAELGNRVLTGVAVALDTTSRGFSAALGAPPSYNAYVEVSRAWESFFREDYEDVFRRLDRASRLDSLYMPPKLMRAYVETRLDDWTAVDTLLRGLAVHENLLTPGERAVYDGLRADSRGDLLGRLRAARELIELTPASVEGYTLGASSALMVNRPRESLSILSKVDPDRGVLLIAPYYWMSHTPALHRLGDHRTELESARAGLRRFPNRYWTQVNLLIALAALGDVGAIRREITRVTPDDPSPVNSVRQKSLWVWRELRAHGHGLAAAEWLANLLTQPATEGDSSVTGVLVEGDIQSAGERWAPARRLYAAGLVSHPLSPILLGRLGATAAHQGDSVEARRIDKLLDTLPAPHLFGSQSYARARIAAAMGDRASAVELLRLAWGQGRPLTFDSRDNDDVHSDPEFDSLRDYFPFQTLIRTD
jgi:DNA-binding SARP family transcriptional activator/TolB-like protein